MADLGNDFTLQRLCEIYAVNFRTERSRDSLNLDISIIVLYRIIHRYVFRHSKCTSTPVVPLLRFER